MIDTTYKSLLQEFISLKSISTDSAYASEIDKTANWLNDLFLKNGFNSKLVLGYDNPIVVASYEVSPDAETCLVYGHYDVQPASIDEGWYKEPFELFEKDGRLIARGVVDNKGQVLIHIFSVLEAIKTGNLKYNVKFMIEGNEETGSPNMPKFVKENKDLLKADFAMISDGELTYEHPSIELGFRGIFNTTLEVWTSDRELHSGLYGGTVPNAAQELSKILVGLLGEDREIKIPGFYDSVEVASEEALENNKKVPFSKEEFVELTGCKEVLLEEGFDFYNQLGFRPSMEITGLKSGYVGEGYRNSVPNYAMAKINFRLTASQEPKESAEIFEKHIMSIVPSYLKVKVTSDQMSKGVILDVDNKYVSSAKETLSKHYDKDVILKYCGATLPIVTDFDELLGIPQVLIPLGNEDCAMHAANENFKIEVLEKALAFSKDFFTKS